MTEGEVVKLEIGVRKQSHFENSKSSLKLLPSLSSFSFGTHSQLTKGQNIKKKKRLRFKGEEEKETRGVWRGIRHQSLPPSRFLKRNNEEILEVREKKKVSTNIREGWNPRAIAVNCQRVKSIHTRETRNREKRTAWKEKLMKPRDNYPQVREKFMGEIGKGKCGVCECKEESIKPLRGRSGEVLLLQFDSEGWWLNKLTVTRLHCSSLTTKIYCYVTLSITVRRNDIIIHVIITIIVVAVVIFV